METKFRLLFLLLFLYSFPSLAQITDRTPGYLAYENFTISEGLPGVIPKEIIQDKKGFIWIATFEGLARFDGYQFKLYQPDTANLKMNVIQQLYEDRDGNIICGGSSLWRFNTKLEKFFTLPLKLKDEEMAPPTYDLLVDDLGFIWVCAWGKGVRIISPKPQNSDSIIVLGELSEIGERDSILMGLMPLEGKDIIQLLNMGDNENRQTKFQVKQEQEYLLAYFGEYLPNGTWGDVGWLENQWGDTIWEPDLAKSVNAGNGSRRYLFRLQFDTIRLTPGNYTLKFKSNEGFSAKNLGPQLAPYAQLWGIQLIPLNGQADRQNLLAKVLKFKAVQNSGRWLSSRFAHTIHKDKKGRIYVGTIVGMDRFSSQYDDESKGFQFSTLGHFQFKKEAPGYFQGIEILTIKDGTDDEVWITGFAPYLNQRPSFTLERFDTKTESFALIQHSVPIQPKVANKGWIHYLSALVPDGQGGVWLSAAHNGLYHIPKAHFKSGMPEAPEKDAFIYNFNEREHLVHDLLIDRNNNLWITTNESQLFKLNARSKQADYFELPNVTGIESGKPEYIFGDTSEELWITTTINGEKKLVHFYPYNKNATVETIPIAADIKNVFGDLKDRDGNTWFGTSAGQLAKYDSSTRQLSFQRIANDDLTFVHFQDESRRIWVSDMRSNVFRLDPATNSLESIPTFSDTSKLGLWDGLSFLYLIDGTIWTGYIAGGLGKISQATIEGRDTFLFTEFLPGYRTLSFALDHQKRPWIGTAINGLILFDEEKGIIKQYTTANGLLNNNVSKLIMDKHKRLWIQTMAGMQLFDIEKEEFLNFSFIRQLPNKNGTSYPFLTKDNKLITSSDKGFYVVSLDSIFADTIPPAMVLTNFLINNQPVRVDSNSVLSSSITYMDALRLQYFQNNIAIEYAGIHHEAPKEIIYAYRMLGLNDAWIQVGKERIARFPKLPPGNYTFEVKAANPDGVWTEKPASLSITVMPPWFWNNWSKLLYFLILAGGGLTAYRFQLKSRLDAVEKERLAELDIVKSRLYTNITHEFRTPLTIILGMADNARNNPKDWFAEGLKMIKHNGQRLLLLVNQMLDLAKLESGSMALQMVQGNVIPFLAYITQSFQSFAISKNVRLHFLSKESQLMMDYDNEKWLQLLSNLISNAVKHTPKDGDIYVQTEQVLLNQKPYLNIAIRDTGNGIPPDKLPTIFDRFQQGDDSSTRQQEGTGIGLALTKELVTLLGGEISVKSEVGRGATFIVALPIRNEAPLKDEPDMAMVTKTVSPFIVKQTIPNLVPEPISEPGNKPILLIIEDNLDVITYLQSCLPSTFQIEVATDGQMGIEKALEIIPDIIISDVMMPEKDGFEVVDTLKQDERTSHVPILLLTAKADIESKLEGLERGADAYLAKPFNAQELNLSINNLMTLLQKLRRRYASQILPLPTQDKNLLKEDVFVQKVRRAIEQNLDKDDWKVPHLASAIKLSREQLYRKLMALTDLSPSEFIRRMRLERGKELLETTDLQVSEIAYQVGFKEPAHFSNAFKELYGIPPGAIRK